MAHLGEARGCDQAGVARAEYPNPHTDVPVAVLSMTGLTQKFARGQAHRPTVWAMPIAIV